MAGEAAGGDCMPRQRIRVHGLEENEGAVAFLPCSEAKAEKMDGGDGAMVEFSDDDELGRRSGRQGHELQEVTKTKT
jgi:hypothetical protein